MTGDERTETEKYVLAALEKSGYPLEMRVAECFMQAGLGVDQNWHYVDPETGKLRESDVSGLLSVGDESQVVQIGLIAECKTGTQPWVVFRPREPGIADRRFLLDLLFIKELGADERLWPVVSQELFPAEGTFLDPRMVGYSIATAKGARDDNRDPAYNAVRAALSAAMGAVAEQGEVGWPITLVVVPVVVVSCPVLDGWLDDAGDVQVRETAVAHLSMRASRGDGPKRCVVATLEGLPSVVAMAQRTANAFLAGLRTVPGSAMEAFDLGVPREPEDVWPTDGLDY